MLSHRSFFCLLLCVCILFGLFSVSAFAIEDDRSYFNGEEVGLNIVDENGFSLLATDVSYTVKNYWKTATSSSWTNYTNHIITDTQYPSINIKFEITLTSEIEKNSNFDVTLNLNSDTYGSITVTNFQIFDSAGNPSCSDLPSVNVNGSRVDVINIWNDLRSAYKLELYITVNNPSYSLDDGSGGGEEPEVTEAPTEAPTEPPQEPQEPEIGSIQKFYIIENDISTEAQFEYGMNWGEWVKSSFKVKDLLNFSFGIGSQVLENGEWVYKKLLYSENNGGTIVQSSDLIQPEENYYLVNYYDNLNLLSISNYKFNFNLSTISVSVMTDEETQGGILGWIKNIFNSIKNLPANIASKISGFFTELGNKISALGDAIINGIKGLFIPSEDSIEEMKSKFEQLLEERFGAVYESTAVIDNFANAFFNTAQVQAVANTGGTIHFPLVSVPLAGTEFSFGGWDVDLIPDSFEGIVELLKMAIDIVCTFVFINALRKKLEGILR